MAKSLGSLNANVSDGKSLQRWWSQFREDSAGIMLVRSQATAMIGF